MRNSISLSSARKSEGRRRSCVAACMCVASWHNLICTLAHPFKLASIHSAIHCAHCIKRIKIHDDTTTTIHKPIGTQTYTIYKYILDTHSHSYPATRLPTRVYGNKKLIRWRSFVLCGFKLETGWENKHFYLLPSPENGKSPKNKHKYQLQKTFFDHHWQ